MKRISTLWKIGDSIADNAASKGITAFEYRPMNGKVYFSCRTDRATQVIQSLSKGNKDIEVMRAIL